MLIAMNEAKKQVTATKELCKETTYYCPACKSPVYLKAGSVIRAHFAHFKRSNCAVFSEGETEEHLLGKQQLYDWLVRLGYEVEMEAYLPKLNQRPDILVSINGQKIALEFQCSGLAIEKVKERTNGYLINGYKVIWLLGEQFDYKRKLTAFHKACLTNMNDQLVLFHYSVKKQQLTYRYNFQMLQNKKITCVSKRLKCGKNRAIDLTKKSPLAKQVVMIEREHQKLQRQYPFPNANMQQFLQILYNQQESLLSVPKELYVTVPTEWLIQTYSYEWKYHLIQWLEQHKPRTILTKKKLLKWVPDLDYYDIPQISTQQKLQPILEFIDVLTESNVLRPIRQDKWSFVQPAKRYKYLEEKFK